MKRYAMRRDENEPDIIAALEAIGCTVYQMDQPVDLLVGRGAKNILIEIKNPAKPRKDQQLTPAQRKFFDAWKGQVMKIETADQAIELVTKITVTNAL